MGRKSFDTWYYKVTCATLWVSFSLKSKAINVFLKHVPKSNAYDQSNQARKKLICHVKVKNYLSNFSWKFLIKIESTWRREIKEQVWVTGLLFVFKSASLALKQVTTCIWKPKIRNTFDTVNKWIKFLHWLFWSF